MNNSKTCQFEVGHVVLNVRTDDVGVITRMQAGIISVDTGWWFATMHAITDLIRLPYNDLGEYVLAGIS